MALKISRMIKKKQLEEAFDDKEDNAFVLHAIIDKLLNKNHIKNLYLLRSLLIQLLQVCLLPEEKTKETIDITEETNELAQDFGFSVAGVDQIFIPEGTPMLREFVISKFPSPSLKTRQVWKAGK